MLTRARSLDQPAGRGQEDGAAPRHRERAQRDHQHAPGLPRHQPRAAGQGGSQSVRVCDDV